MLNEWCTIMKLFIVLAIAGIATAADPFIRGGEEAPDGAWPSQGSLQIQGSHYCGISLISSWWGVTAGNCVGNSPVNLITHRFGSNSRLQGGQVVGTEYTIVHENRTFYENDIAVVKFSEEVHVNSSFIGPITMAAVGSNHTDAPDCWIAGWGYRASGSDIPARLRQANVSISESGECSSLQDGVICIVGDQRICIYDEGAPLICKNGDDRELVGVASWGFCNQERTSLFSSIAVYRDWIEEKIGI